jgi:hypothetical protein
VENNKLKPKDLKTDKILKQDFQFRARKDGSIRIFLKNNKYASVFSKALIDVLLPIQDQKYLIEENYNSISRALSIWKQYEDSFKNKKKRIKPTYKSNYFPIPEIFSSHKDKAEIFAEFWEQHITPVKIIGTRSKKGKQVLKVCFRKKTLDIMFRQKEIWM